MAPLGYWKTNDGRMLALRNMEDAHLSSTVTMLERKRKALLADVECFAPQVGESMADDIGPDFSDVFVETLKEIDDKLAELKAELFGRKPVLSRR